MTNNTSFLPAYDFSPELNTEILRKILPLMVQNNVPINPINYAIWYDYVLGSNPQLNEVINNLITERKGFDANTSFDLYKKYICNASLESFERINAQIQMIIAQTQESLSDTQIKTYDINQSFVVSSDRLNNLSGDSILHDVLKDILHSTSSLAETSMIMQNSLEEANKKLEEMRSEMDEIRQLAITDPLTGLLNRRAFDQIINELLTPSGSTTCLVLIDIDHFKNVNDTHGHIVGDQVIKYLAALMKKHTEKHHYNARYGGEEMAIIMPNTPLERAMEIAETLRIAMEKSLLKRKDSGIQLHKITISLGVTAIRDDDVTESFIARADKALYSAKDKGRNKVVLEN